MNIQAIVEDNLKQDRKRIAEAITFACLALAAEATVMDGEQLTARQQQAAEFGHALACLQSVLDDPHLTGEKLVDLILAPREIPVEVSDD